MKVKFDVLGCGSFEGKTRDGRIFQRLRMMGFVYDCEGDRIPCTCDMGFEGRVDSEPKSGDSVIVDISAFDVRNAMASMTFSSLVHVQAKK